MTTTFIRHELKAFWRARNTGKSIAVHIVIGILVLIMLVYALLVGYVMDEILKKAFHSTPVIVSFSGIILLYYVFELLMRMQLQELPTLRVQPYLQLPIKRNTLVKYLSLTAMLSAFNLWPFLLFIPFIIKVVAAQLGGVVATVFILSLFGFTIFNNYLALYIKRKANLNGWLYLIVSVALALFVTADFKLHLYSIREMSYAYFGRLNAYPVLVLVPLIMALIVYYINFAYLKDNLYLDILVKHKKLRNTAKEIPLLKRLGVVGALLANEIKLIVRNKRSRSSLIMSCFMLLYGFIFYTNHKMPEGARLFAAMFMSGIFIINYGQFMYGWQGGYFDGFMVSKINFKDFLRAKYILFTTISTLAFLFTIPDVYFGARILLVQFVMYLWNIGVNTTIILFFANRNSKRIDLGKGAAFNWEGMGVTQLLMAFPIMAFPFLFYVPLNIWVSSNAGLALLGGIATIMLITRRYWINFLAADLEKRKYKIMEGFRNK